MSQFRGGKKMRKEYEVFIDKLTDLAEGEELDLVIRELSPGRSKYNSHHVKALVYSDPEKSPEGSLLRIRFQRGRAHPSPWAIKILQEIEEFYVEDIS